VCPALAREASRAATSFAVGESGFGVIPGFAYAAPYEDITLKGA
jgi:hypothetical protein